MDLVRANMIQLLWQDGRICARLGFFERDNPAGVGETVTEALRNLADAIDHSDLKVWVPRSAKPYMEDGVQKIACPECGAVHSSDFDRVVAYVCDSCGAGVDVEQP